MSSIAIIFPAFVSEYSGTELTSLQSGGNKFKKWLVAASDYLKIDLTEFDPTGNNFLDDEAITQYISYIYSCALSDILKTNRVVPDFITAYSMGIYAALYYSGSVDFVTGLSLVKKAWDLIHDTCRDDRYSMGMIIGIPGEQIENWCDRLGDAWICNRNNPHTYIISGKSGSVDRILAQSKEDGALRANLLPVSKPYHTAVLKGLESRFLDYVRAQPFHTPAYPYLSAIDRRVISSAEEFQNEVVRNIYSPMNWYETMNHLTGLSTATFFECGAGDGLSRNFRFIEGNFKAFSGYKLNDFLDRSAE